jgi:acyl-CoA oxidase
MPVQLAAQGVVPTPVETMARERQDVPFDLRSMTYAMHGGRKNVELK